MEHYVLDSSAVIAYFKDEAGAEKVETCLNEATISSCIIFMHNASVAEIYYDSLYGGSEQDADVVLKTLASYPITFIETISSDLIKQIGYFKTNYKISFADSFVLASAKLIDAKVLTSDHHEFDVIEKSGDIMFEWIR
jgi:predicted nucleic acid-binding protein